ncbi:MAG: response regulator [Gammaproteobacteria bacterium]|nr:response regulator [Gammaproteobacteria bacterium]
MLVDDNTVDLMLYGRVIKRSGIADRLISCQSADEALEIIRQGDIPDVILLDINMPRLSGFDFLDTATREFGSDFCKVVAMLTTSQDPADQSKANSYPVVKDFFNKPLDADQLTTLATLTSK